MSKFLLRKPLSITALMLASFALVALPMIVAVVLSAVYVDRLSNQGQRLVVQGVQATRASRKLVSIITDMERSARQYAVLSDPQLAMQFTELHREFKGVLTDLERSRLGKVAHWRLDELMSEADLIAQAVQSHHSDSDVLELRFGKFDKLRDSAKTITDEANIFIDSEIANLKGTSQQARFFLLLCIFALIPGVIILVVILAALISRPIRQINAAIRTMGEGDLDSPVSISAVSAELAAIGTQLEWMRRRLSELESEKNQFLRRMSHELKTPLASIREGVELMRDGALGGLSGKQTEVVNILQENSLELLSLIENLLNYAAWQQHRSQLRFSRFCLNEAVDSIVDRHQLSIERKHLRIEAANSRVDIDADPDQLKIMVDNLISNAIKFSPVEGRLHVQILSQGNSVTMRVADDGPGISADEREHIFSPYYQATPAIRSHVQGTGIGLSVVREVVRAHEGEVKVIDYAGAQGACFQICLPQYRAAD